MGSESKTISPIICGHLYQIATKYHDDGEKEALKLLFKMVYMSSEFDMAIIRLMRRFVYNFIQEHSDFLAPGDLSITTIIETTEDMSVDQFLTDVVLAAGEDARSVILFALPMILRIKITAILMDLTICKSGNFFQQAVAMYPESNMKVEKLDTLNLHHEEMFVLLKPGHFDALYSKSFLKKHPCILKYDKESLEEIKVIEHCRMKINIPYIFPEDLARQKANEEMFKKLQNDHSESKDDLPQFINHLRYIKNKPSTKINKNKPNDIIIVIPDEGAEHSKGRNSSPVRESSPNTIIGRIRSIFSPQKKFDPDPNIPESKQPIIVPNLYDHDKQLEEKDTMDNTKTSIENYEKELRNQKVYFGQRVENGEHKLRQKRRNTKRSRENSPRFSEEDNRIIIKSKKHNRKRSTPPTRGSEETKGSGSGNRNNKGIKKHRRGKSSGEYSSRSKCTISKFDAEGERSQSRSKKKKKQKVSMAKDNGCYPSKRRHKRNRHKKNKQYKNNIFPTEKCISPGPFMILFNFIDTMIFNYYHKPRSQIC